MRQQTPVEETPRVPEKPRNVSAEVTPEVIEKIGAGGGI